jgi:hypothetical protein
VPLAHGLDEKDDQQSFDAPEGVGRSRRNHGPTIGGPGRSRNPRMGAASDGGKAAVARPKTSRGRARDPSRQRAIPARSPPALPAAP